MDFPTGTRRVLPKVLPKTSNGRHKRMCIAHARASILI